MSHTSHTRRAKAAHDDIAMLAKLFPMVFVTKGWELHKPLKIGIDKDLAALGVLCAKNAHALGTYCRRRLYRAAIAAGGARIDLDGKPCGEVTAEEQEKAKAALARMDAQAAAKAVAAKAERIARSATATAERTARSATKKAERTKRRLAEAKEFFAERAAARAAQEAAELAAREAAKPKKLSLDDLRAAGRARREKREQAA
jgi:ProP effector